MRSRLTPALLLALGLLLSLGESASAQGAPTPTPTPLDENGIVDAVHVGFAGWVPPDGVAPVWLTLRNDGATEERLRVVARSRRSRNERTVDLPAGGKARVFLALSVSWRMSIEVYRGEKLLFRREVENAPRLDIDNHLIVIDGRPADARKGETTRGTRTLQITSIEPNQASPEAACYAPLGGVVLRALDPGRLTPDQRSALFEYVLLGGRLYLVADGPERLKLTQLLKSLPGRDRKEKVLGRTALVRTYGLGQIITFGDDFIDDMVRRDPRGERLSTGFSNLLASGRERARLGPTYERFGGDVDHPGSGTAGLVVIFFGIYWLVVGPGIALGLRRAKRRTLSLFAVASILGFCCLALVVAGTVRTATGGAFVREVVYVSPEGPSLGVADVTVVSGGGWRYDLQLESTRTFSAMQANESGRRRVRGRWHPEDLNPTSADTRRGREITLDLRPPPWDQRSVHVVQERTDLAPIEAELVGGGPRGKGYEVRVKNPTKASFGPAIVVEDISHQLGAAKAFADLGILKPGEEKRVFLRPGGRIRGANLPSYKGKHWFTSLEIPRGWHGWAKVRNQANNVNSNRLNVRFVVLSRLPNSIKASGDRLKVESHALRIDPVQIGQIFERGYVGVELAMTQAMGGKVVTISRVVVGSPAERGRIQAGDQVISIQGIRGEIPITTVEQFMQEIGRHRPGQKVTISVNRGGVLRQITLNLARRRDFQGR
ncbi:MAG: PDZ domain-containing protein [Planctomycetes bacterium]|nr:PDZ domain-containing protein [Planctomycetota bacterium]